MVSFDNYKPWAVLHARKQRDVLPRWPTFNKRCLICRLIFPRNHSKVVAKKVVDTAGWKRELASDEFRPVVIHRLAAHVDERELIVSVVPDPQTPRNVIQDLGTV